MRVGIIMLMQESNTFLREPTTLKHFEADLLRTGEPMREALVPTHHETAGFFAGLAEAGIEAVPIFAARALPFGVVTAEAFVDPLLGFAPGFDATGYDIRLSAGTGNAVPEPGICALLAGVLCALGARAVESRVTRS